MDKDTLHADTRGGGGTPESDISIHKNNESSSGRSFQDPRTTVQPDEIGLRDMAWNIGTCDPSTEAKPTSNPNHLPVLRDIFFPWS